jgi:uncharacterized protein YukE
VQRLQGSIYYPQNANSAPIRELANNLQQLSKSLVEGGTQLSQTAEYALGSWAGQAAQAYSDHTNKRARTVKSVGTALGKTSPILQTFAAAIDSTSVLYNAGVLEEWAGMCSVPIGTAAIAAGKATQTAAVASLQAAGMTCAGALVAVEAEIAAAQFFGVDKSSLDGLKDAAGSIWESVVDLVTSGDTGAAMSALDNTTNVLGLIGILAGGGAAGSSGRVSQSQKPQLTAQQQQLVDYGTSLNNGKSAVKPFVWGVEGAAEGLRYGAENYSTTVNRRNGTVYTRWTVAGRGSSLGITQQQAARYAHIAHRWTKPLPVVGAVLDGAVQYMTDQGNPNLTETQRVTRAGTATAVQGGGAVAGAAGGAKTGATLGAALGNVPGAVIGGVAGAVIGGFAGSAAGKWVKEQLFAWNPGGVFQ